MIKKKKPSPCEFCLKMLSSGLFIFLAFVKYFLLEVHIRFCIEIYVKLRGKKLQPFPSMGLTIPLEEQSLRNIHSIYQKYSNIFSYKIYITLVLANWSDCHRPLALLRMQLWSFIHSEGKEAMAHPMVFWSKTKCMGSHIIFSADPPC